MEKTWKKTQVIALRYQEYTESVMDSALLVILD
jgi:hypothetical protein